MGAVADPAEPEELDPEPVTEALAETAAEIEQIDVDAPRVAIVAAEREDLLILECAEAELQSRDISSEVRVLSDGGGPDEVAPYTENAQPRGIRVIIAGAGPQGRLPWVITAHTELPVIGVPLTSRGARPGNLDSMLSGGDAAGGEPVAWVALDDATGAALLAARILAT